MKLIEKLNNTQLPIQIALDGPSASGKGLIGSMLAKEWDLKYIQSSIVYRGLALICVEDLVHTDDVQSVISKALNEDIFNRISGRNLNDEKIGFLASKISAIKEVREIMTKKLQKIISETPRIIMEGRDIGTVVAPFADLKIFLSANIDVRAKRRYEQLISEGKNYSLDDITNFLKERDERDKNRKNAPLKAADDAILIDTSYLKPDEVIENIKNTII